MRRTFMMCIVVGVSATTMAWGATSRVAGTHEHPSAGTSQDQGSFLFTAHERDR